MTTDTQLTIKQEILTLAGDPSVPMEQIEGRLAELYNQAEANGDANSMTLVAQSWEHVQIMHATAVKAHELAVAAKEAALEYQSQRDSALEELETTSEDRDAARADLEEVYSALDDPFDTDNERIRDMVSFVEDVTVEDYEMNYGEMMMETAYEEAYLNLTENLTNIYVPREQASKFATILTSEYHLGKLTAEQKETLREFVKSFVGGLE